MPVAFLNASSVGWACVLSSTSMYACQFDQLMVLSTSDGSEAVGLADADAPPPPAAFVPQAARAAAAPSAPAPCITVRRVSRPRISAGDGAMGRLSVMSRGLRDGLSGAVRAGRGLAVAGRRTPGGA